MANKKSEPQSNRSALRAPAIACSIAALILAALFIPGLLTFPEQMAGPTDADVALVDEANQVLRDRVEALKQALNSDICLEDGEFTLPNGPLPANIKSALPGPPLTQIKPITGAVQNIQGFDGSVGDLLDSASVFVRVTSNNQLGMGSGVFIASDLVLTNAHVVGDDTSSTFLVYNSSIGPLAASLVAKGGHDNAGDVDLAVLRVSGVSPDQVFLTIADVNIGQSVTAAGFPMAVMRRDSTFMDWVQNPNGPDPGKKPFRDTQILNLVQNESGVQWLYHTATIDKGNSGGPLVDDCGYLVGINTSFTFRASREGDSDVKIPFYRAIGGETVEQFFINNRLPALSQHAGTCGTAIGSNT